MNKRHQDLLNNLLEKAYLAGIAYVSWNEIYHWYNIARLGALTRRDLEDRWEDISQGMAGRLMAIEQKDGVFLFAEKSVRPVVNDAQHTNGGLSSDKQSAELSSTWPRDVPRSGSPRSSDLQTATDTHLGPSSGC